MKRVFPCAIGFAYRQISGLVIVSSFFLLIIPHGLTQEETMLNESVKVENQTPDNSVYFADVVVRGQPIFQIGSLAQMNARQRATIVNRRIASLLSQSQSIGEVSAKPDNPRKIATLQVNNRVLMTVTEQDAQDFGLSVDQLADKWASRLNEAFEQPPLAIDVGKRLYGTVRQLLRNTVSNLPSLLGAIIIVGFTWAIAKGVRYAAFTWAQQTEGDSSSEILIGRLSYGAVWVIGAVVTLGVLGIDFAALLGALGLTSVAIGFSLKDVLSNYISGVIILAARPFRINDQVVIDDYEGTITQIQLRSTTIKTYDGRFVYIPNQEVFQASITNNTAAPRRRSFVMVGIDYDADISEAQQAIYKALEKISEVEKNPVPEILVRELAASTVNLEVRFWVDSRRAGFLATTSKVTHKIKEALEQANIEMPTDIYTLIFRNSPTPLKATIQESGMDLLIEDETQK